MALFDNAWYISSVAYTAATAWAANTSKVCGNIVRQATAPAVNSERCFVCIASTSGTGQTGASEPAGASWTGATRGQKTTDNTLTWMECTGIAGLNGDLANTPTWTQYRTQTASATLGQVIQNAAGTLLLICTTAGAMSSLGSEPSWTAFTNAGATTADSSATWTTLGAPSNFGKLAAPHARLLAARTSTWGIDGNKFFLADNHAETQSTTLTVPGVIVNNNTLTPHYSFDHTGSVPPTSVKSGAQITTTGSGAINLCTGVGGDLYFDGVSFSCGSGANGPTFSLLNNSRATLSIQNATLSMPGTSQSTLNIGDTPAGSDKIRLNNVVINAGAAPIINFNASDLEWKNTASALTGTVPTVLFGGTGNTSLGGFSTLRGVDLSAMGSGKTLFNPTTSTSIRGVIADCKINASVTVATAASNVQGQWLDFIRCDSGGHGYMFNRTWYEGSLVNENTIVRTGGASDGTTGVSWKIVTTANSNWQQPFDSFQAAKWNAVTGSNVTVTMYGITNQASLPNNDDIWMEVQYLGDSGSPQASFANTTKASGLSSNAALSADTSSAWGAGASAYQTAHAYGAFTGVILAGNASPQQLWFMASHSGTGTSGSSTTIFNGQSDGAQVTDNAGANQIVWQAMTRFSMVVTLSSPQPQLAGDIYAMIRAAKVSSTYYVDPGIVLS